MTYNRAMFVPNVACTIVSMDSPTDLYGQPTEQARVNTMCGVVRLEIGILKTSVRADSSASRGQAIERVAQSRLLFEPATKIKPNDRVIVNGFTLEVESIYPRHAIQGELDHWQVDLNLWASE